MTITRKDPWTWEIEFPVGDYNQTEDIEAFPDGLSVPGGRIPWSEIDDARTCMPNDIHTNEAEKPDATKAMFDHYARQQAQDITSMTAEPALPPLPAPFEVPNRAECSRCGKPWEASTGIRLGGYQSAMNTGCSNCGGNSFTVTIGGDVETAEFSRSQMMEYARLCMATPTAAPATPEPSTYFMTVGKLRELLEGRGYEEMVLAQVVATDGKAWGMAASCGPIFGQSRGLVVTLTHPNLYTLPSWPVRTP